MKTKCALLLLPCVLSCADPLVDPQTVVGLRLLGTRVSVAEDASRARVEPGDTASQQWLVVSDEPRAFTGLALWCETVPSSVGVPPCRDPFEVKELVGSSSEPLAMDFTLPRSLDASAGWVHRLALCETTTDGSGEPPRWREERQQFECPTGEPITGIYRGDSATLNHNPSLLDDVLELDGDSWPELDSALPLECGAEGMREIAADSTVDIQLQNRGEDREALEDESYAAAKRETLTFTHVTTWPGLERAFSVIDDASTSSRFRVAFRSEQELPKGSQGELVRFALTVRDGRGGTDWLERWFCLVP